MTSLLWKKSEATGRADDANVIGTLRHGCLDSMSSLSKAELGWLILYYILEGSSVLR